MSPNKYKLKYTSQFKKDLKQAEKRGLKLERLKDVINVLAQGKTLPDKNLDHVLNGRKGHRECHIQPDWLLVYHINESVLVLTLSRTGSHSDLFG